MAESFAKLPALSDEVSRKTKAEIGKGAKLSATHIPNAEANIWAIGRRIEKIMLIDSLAYQVSINPPFIAMELLVPYFE